jgi:hypothetical protein
MWHEYKVVFGAKVFGAKVFGAKMFGAKVFGAKVFGAKVFGAKSDPGLISLRLHLVYVLDATRRRSGRTICVHLLIYPCIEIFI